MWGFCAQFLCTTMQSRQSAGENCCAAVCARPALTCNISIFCLCHICIAPKTLACSHFLHELQVEHVDNRMHGPLRGCSWRKSCKSAANAQNGGKMATHVPMCIFPAHSANINLAATSMTPQACHITALWLCDNAWGQASVDFVAKIGKSQHSNAHHCCALQQKKINLDVESQLNSNFQLSNLWQILSSVLQHASKGAARPPIDLMVGRIGFLFFRIFF